MGEQPANRAKGRARPIDVARVVWEIVHREIPEESVRLVRVRSAWRDIVPRAIAANTWPAAVRGDRLVLHVHDNQWLHELHYARQELLTRIAAVVPDAGIVGIDVFLGKVPPPESLGDATPLGEEVAPSDAALASEPPQETLEALAAVGDARLREQLTAARAAMGRPRGGAADR